MFRGFLGTIVTGGSEVRRCPPGEDVEEYGQAPVAEYTADSPVSQGHSSSGSLYYELDLARLEFGAALIADQAYIVGAGAIYRELRDILDPTARFTAPSEEGLALWPAWPWGWPHASTILTVTALVFAWAQLRSQSKATATGIYQRYINLALQYPHFAEPKYEELTKHRETDYDYFKHYEWFVSSMLYACDAVLALFSKRLLSFLSAKIGCAELRLNYIIIVST